MCPEIDRMLANGSAVRLPDGSVDVPLMPSAWHSTQPSPFN